MCNRCGWKCSISFQKIRKFPLRLHFYFHTHLVNLLQCTTSLWVHTQFHILLKFISNFAKESTNKEIIEYFIDFDTLSEYNFFRLEISHTKTKYVYDFTDKKISLFQINFHYRVFIKLIMDFLHLQGENLIIFIRFIRSYHCRSYWFHELNLFLLL